MIYAFYAFLSKVILYYYDKLKTVNQRYVSLDVFRGGTVAFMILVNNPGTWSHMFDPLEHANWHGLTPTDLVFPLFLFAVGNAMAFVIPRLWLEGDAAFWKKVITHTVLIFLIGTFLNWFPFSHWVKDELIFREWEWTRSDGSTIVLVIGYLWSLVFPINKKIQSSSFILITAWPPRYPWYLSISWK